MKITFLGTGSMLPTRERNPIGVLISHSNETLLFDCGEGTQRQMKIAGISPASITKILLSHWHGDHVFGLPGLLLTMGTSHYQGTLALYGPKQTKIRFKKMRDLYIHQNTLKIAVTEISQKKFYENADFSLEALPLDHSTPVMGYSLIEKDKRKINVAYLKQFGLQQHPILKQLQQGKDIVWKGKKIKAAQATTIKKGKKITFVTDTGICANIVKLAKNADVLICESTHLDELKEKSKEYKHLTAKQAALLAKKAKVKKLVLMHFSQRYKNTKPLEKEARQYFKNTVCAYDFFTLQV